MPTPPGDVNMAEIMKYLRENLPDDVIMTNGAGNYATWRTGIIISGIISPSWRRLQVLWAMAFLPRLQAKHDFDRHVIPLLVMAVFR